jgi:hypothetical protein
MCFILLSAPGASGMINEIKSMRRGTVINGRSDRSGHVNVLGPARSRFPQPFGSPKLFFLFFFFFFFFSSSSEALIIFFLFFIS